MTCEYCDQTHGKRCPSVKAIEYFENGKIKRVEFMTQMDSLATQAQTAWQATLLPIGLQPLSPTAAPYLPQQTITRPWPQWDQSQRDTICSDAQRQSDRGNQ